MLLSIDEGNRQPIYLQIVRQIKEQILIGELAIGEELPSVRDLGDALGISLHTARSAYRVLAEEGLLRVRLGKKARIAARTASMHAAPLDEGFSLRIRELVVDGLLQGGSTDRLHRVLDQEIQAISTRGADVGIADRGKEGA